MNHKNRIYIYIKFNEIWLLNFTLVYISSLKLGNITWKHDSDGLK